MSDPTSDKLKKRLKHVWQDKLIQVYGNDDSPPSIEEAELLLSVGDIQLMLAAAKLPASTVEGFSRFVEDGDKYRLTYKQWRSSCLAQKGPSDQSPPKKKTHKTEPTSPLNRSLVPLSVSQQTSEADPPGSPPPAAAGAVSPRQLVSIIPIRNNQPDKPSSNVFEAIQAQERKAEKEKIETKITVLSNEIEERKSEIQSVLTKIKQREEILEGLNIQIAAKKKELSDKVNIQQNIPSQYHDLSNEIKTCQRIARDFLSRRRILKFDSSVVRDYAARSEAKSGRLRNKTLQEILDSEKTYVTSLKNLWENYAIPLKEKQLCKEIDYDMLFSELELILDLNTILLKKLEDRLRKWPRVQLFGDIFRESAPAMKLYYRYIRNFNKKTDLINQYNKDPEFAKFTSAQEAKMGGTINSFLIMPVQRLPRYQMLLQSLISLTPKEHVDYLNLIHAKDAVVNVNVYIEQRHSIEIQKDQLVKTLMMQRLKQQKSKKEPKKITAYQLGVTGFIMVSVISAKLPCSCYSFVRILFTKQIHETDVSAKKTDNPTWQRDFVLEVEKFGSSTVVVQIYKQPKTGEMKRKEDLIGEISFPIKEIIDKKSISSAFNIVFTDKFAKKVEKPQLEGTLTISFQYHPVEKEGVDEPN